MWEILINGQRFGNCFTKIEWSGGIHGTARKVALEFESNLVDCKVGDSFALLLDNTRLFRGMVYEVVNTAEERTELVAMDEAIYLNRNHFVKNFFKWKPSDIFKHLCGRIGLKTGRFPKDTVLCSFPAIDMSGFEILLRAYTIQHKKDGGIYSIVANDGKIEVVDQGVLIDGVVLDADEDCVSAEYSQSLEEMVNQVIVYKTEADKPQVLSVVKNEEDIKRYGTFQEVMEYEKDKDNIFDAKERLKGLSNKARLTVRGDVNLQAGYSVAVALPKQKLVGEFLIEQDRHVITDGEYITELVLGFENVMPEVDFEEETKTKEKKKNIEVKGGGL